MLLLSPPFCTINPYQFIIPGYEPRPSWWEATNWVMTQLAHIMSFTQTHRKIWVVFNQDLLEAMEKARLFLPTDLDTEHVAQSTQTHKTVEWQTASQCCFKHSQYNKILHVVSFTTDACDVPVCWSHLICLLQTQDFFLRYNVFCIFSHQWANKAFFFF